MAKCLSACVSPTYGWEKQYLKILLSFTITDFLLTIQYTLRKKRLLLEKRETTVLLQQMANGDREAGDIVMPRIYDELRSLSARYLADERVNHTLQPTALANEAYMRLVDQSRTDWKDRAHFLAIASEMIRRVLVDHARSKHAAKRGGGNCPPMPINEAIDAAAMTNPDLLALNEALDELDALNKRHRQVVEMRFFGGLTIGETAEVLSVSPQTIKSDWAVARAWLRARLDD